METSSFEFESPELGAKIKVSLCKCHCHDIKWANTLGIQGWKSGEPGLYDSGRQLVALA